MQGLDLTNREVANDTVGVEALSLNTGFEATGRDGNFEISLCGKFTFKVFDQHLILSDDEHFGHGFVFQIA